MNVEHNISTKLELDKSDIEWISNSRRFGKNFQLHEREYPLRWQKYPNDVISNPNFRNWMLVSMLPTFKKLYGEIILNEGEFLSGKYKINITYLYEVKSFKGRKFIVLSNTSFMGGKNILIPISFFISSVGFLGIGFLLYAIHKKN